MSARLTPSKGKKEGEEGEVCEMGGLTPINCCCCCCCCMHLAAYVFLRRKEETWEIVTRMLRWRMLMFVPLFQGLQGRNKIKDKGCNECHCASISYCCSACSMQHVELSYVWGEEEEEKKRNWETEMRREFETEETKSTSWFDVLLLLLLRPIFKYTDYLGIKKKKNLRLSLLCYLLLLLNRTVVQS